MLLWFAAAVAVLAVALALYQAVAAARDNRSYQPPGQLVDVDGRRLHLLVGGEGQEQPTIILEEGMASFSSNWYWVQTELAADTRVVAYDRAGLGWSDPPPAVHDACDSAADLHQALEAADITGPYVVVGHSYGGLVVRAFTDLYPDEVVGMVLADASHPDQWARIPASRDGQVIAFGNKVTGWLARLGLMRLLNLNRSYVAGLPERPAAEMTANFNQPRAWITSGDTLAIWNERTRPRLNEALALDGLPLIVLSVTDQPANAEALTSLQNELATLSNNSLHITVEGANHVGLVAERDHAAAVVAAIRQVLAAAQTGRPLAELAP